MTASEQSRADALADAEQEQEYGPSCVVLPDAFEHDYANGACRFCGEAEA